MITPTYRSYADVIAAPYEELQARKEYLDMSLDSINQQLDLYFNRCARDPSKADEDWLIRTRVAQRAYKKERSRVDHELYTRNAHFVEEKEMCAVLGRAYMNVARSLLSKEQNEEILTKAKDMAAQWMLVGDKG